ncbi:(2Fe-2S) ferredoxin domain-containing protein [bacterium]|nr:(2Fe-2S) ferredoxin domain-containing protein [bacterium]
MTLKLVRKSQHAHVLVCRSCGDAFASDETFRAVTASAHVKKNLESELLNGRDGWQVRVVESGCLDICPVGAISVRLVGAENTESKTLTWTIDPKSDAGALATEIQQFLRRK